MTYCERASKTFKNGLPYCTLIRFHIFIIKMKLLKKNILICVNVYENPSNLSKTPILP